MSRQSGFETPEEARRPVGFPTDDAVYGNPEHGLPLDDGLDNADFGESPYVSQWFGGIKSMEEAASQLLLSGDNGESMAPEARRLATQFAMLYPGDYKRLQGQLTGSPLPPPREPTQQRLNRAESFKQRNPAGYARYERAANEIKRTTPSDPRLVEEIAADLYDRQLRRERGMDRESRLARRGELSRSRAVAAISRRHGGNPAMLRRAINNWNSRNPNNRLRMEDFGASSAGQDVRTRPGDVVEVDDIRSVNPRNVAAGSILMDSTGPYRMARRPDGSVRGQAVMQDSNSGFYFPDPDRFTNQYQFDEVMSRQDRVNLRQAIMQSGNSVMAAEQRRLEDAREAAANSIPEIRDAGLKEVNELERALHYRYINEAAALKAPGPGGGRPDIQISGPTVKPEEVEETPTFSNQEVLKAFEDYFKSAGPAEQRRLSGMSMADRLQMGFRLLQPFAGGGSDGEGEDAAFAEDAVVGGARGTIRDFRFDSQGLSEPPDKDDTQGWSEYTQRLEEALYRNIDAAFESGMTRGELATALDVIAGELGRHGMNPQQMPRQPYAILVARIQGLARDIGYEPTRSPAQEYPDPRQPTPRTPPRRTRQDALEAFEEWREGQFERTGTGRVRGSAEDRAEDERLKGLSEEEKIRIGLRQLEVISGQGGLMDGIPQDDIDAGIAIRDNNAQIQVTAARSSPSLRGLPTKLPKRRDFSSTTEFASAWNEVYRNQVIPVFMKNLERIKGLPKADRAEALASFRDELDAFGINAQEAGPIWPMIEAAFDRAEGAISG